MFRKLLVGFTLLLGLSLTVSSCAPGVYAGTSVGVGVGGPAYYGGYGPGYYGGYYGPRYYGYAPRPIIVNPRPVYRGGFRSDAGFHGGGGGFHGGGFGGGRRGGR